MSEPTYAEARGVGLVAGAMLAVTLIVAIVFVWTGLTPRPTAAPPAATAPAAETAPASN
jgi:hypothetical protein